MTSWLNMLGALSRFLSEYKGDEDDDPPRKLISIEKMSMLVNSILNPRDRAIIVLLA